jgi:hypothetical protein
MITARMFVSEGPVTRNVKVRAASLARARRIAGEGRPGISVELIGPVRPVAHDTRTTSRATVPGSTSRAA